MARRHVLVFYIPLAISVEGLLQLLIIFTPIFLLGKAAEVP